MKNKLWKSSTKPRVVIDTNIFVSAFIWGGNPQAVLEKWFKGKFSLLISPYLLSEILKVLKRFDFQKENLNSLKRILEEQCIKIIPKTKVNICRDKKDNDILSLCQDGRADFLISGDKDLLVLKKFKNTKIISPKQFFKI